MSEIGGRQGPNPAGELAKTVLGPVPCASGLLVAFVGVIDEDVSLEFVDAIMGLVTMSVSTVLLIRNPGTRSSPRGEPDVGQPPQPISASRGGAGLRTREDLLVAPRSSSPRRGR